MGYSNSRRSLRLQIAGNYDSELFWLSDVAIVRLIRNRPQEHRDHSTPMFLRQRLLFPIHPAP